jgi:hypothetical protein
MGGDQGLDAVAEAACHLAGWYGALNTPTPVPRDDAPEPGVRATWCYISGWPSEEGAHDG